MELVISNMCVVIKRTTPKTYFFKKKYLLQNCSERSKLIVRMRHTFNSVLIIVNGREHFRRVQSFITEPSYGEDILFHCGALFQSNMEYYYLFQALWTIIPENFGALFQIIMVFSSRAFQSIIDQHCGAIFQIIVEALFHSTVEHYSKALWNINSQHYGGLFQSIDKLYI